TVNYAEVIQENDSWYNEISPILRKGQTIGYDIMVITDGFQFSELVTAGDLTPLDQKLMPNFYRYARPRFKNRSFDPGNTYSMPWAGGAPRIARNPNFIHKEVPRLDAPRNPPHKSPPARRTD